MNVLVYFIGAILCFLFGYRIYSRFVAKSIAENTEQPTPAVQINDGRDFVPTRPSVLFAHHFATIAGAGPIVGPTLGILYGVGPAWLWVVLGAIFFGGVHDFVSLFASVRERGSSLSAIAKKSLGETGFLLFIFFTIVLIVLITSAFLSLTAISLTSMYPLDKLGLSVDQTLLRTITLDGQANGIVGGIASTSVIVITLLAPLIGLLVTRKNINTPSAYLIASVVAILSIYIGFKLPLSLSPFYWIFIIAVYTFFACQVPCWLILQPRDFVNVQILYLGIFLMALGVVITGSQGLTVSAPISNYQIGAEKMGPVWPFLFITIACGAISGFHSLVTGGTTSKQLAREKQARPIGYGAMLLEGTLAVLVIITLGSSLSYSEYIAITWPTVGNGNPVLAFALSVGNLLNSAFGLKLAIGTVLGILVVEGFLITTLDSAVRLNRYLFEELWNSLFSSPPAFLQKFWFNSGLSVVLMLLLALSNGYRAIWPLFGATNQLLAALTLVTATVWLHHAGKKNWFTMIPALVMMATTIVALVYYLVVKYIPTENWLLAATDLILVALALGVLSLSVKKRFLSRTPISSAISS